MDRYRKLGRDFLFMLLGNMGSKVLAFLIVPLYTAVLTTTEYGAADLISSTVTLLFPFFSLIICESMMRFALEKSNDPKEVWRVGSQVWLFGTGLLLLLSPVVLWTPLREYYGFVVLHYVLYSAHQCVSYYVRGVNRVKEFAVSGMLQTFVTVVLNLIFLLAFRMGVSGYLLARIGGEAASTVYMLLAVKIWRCGLFVRVNDKALRRQMLRYSVPLIPNSVSWWIANTSDRYILTAFSGMAATGVYSVAYKIPTLISTVSGLFMSAWKLTVAENFGTEESRRFYSDVYSKLTALMCMLLSFLFLINKPLSRLLFAKDFYQAWQYVPVLLTASVFHSYSDFFGSVYTSSYKTRFIAMTTALGAATNILLNFLLIPRWGAMGAAVATLFGYGAVWLCRLLGSRAILKIQLNLARNAIAYGVVGLQMLAACRQFSTECLFSALCFLTVLLVMRGEIKELLNILLRKFSRGGSV